MSQVLRKVLRADTCAGCGLCQSITGGAVEVELNERGYYRPSLDDNISLEQDTLIRAVCPAITVQHGKSDIPLDPIWGPVLQMQTGYAQDAEIRFKGSSGGVLSALQIHLLESGKVEAVINIGASDEAPLLNQVYLCKTVEDIASNAGSRYAPSAPLRDIHHLIKGLTRVAFVGKPCDVSALRRLSEYDSALKSKQFYFLSFLCAGVPSQNATNALVQEMGYQPDQVAKFRYRGEGWPGFAKVEAVDGSSAKMSYNDSWGKILNRQLQTRCKICPDGTGEFADISCGDAWHGNDKGFPDFKELAGRSAIIVRSRKGQELLRDAVDEGDVVLEPSEFSLDDLSKMQPYQVNRRKMVIPRSLAFLLFRRQRVRSTFRSDFAVFKTVSVLRGLREFLGTMNRLVFGRM